MNTVKFDSCLLPRSGVDLCKWAVIACDQYTSDRRYWKELENYVGGAPSTLRLICPEVYLADADCRMADITKSAKEYADGVLDEVPGGVLVKRTTESGERWGLVALIDLDAYSYAPSKAALIRATEGTVPERIPPRLKVRKSCDIELPHVLTLIDDRDKTVVEPLIGTGKKLYDVQLYGGGGRLEGWQITDTAPVTAALSALEEKTTARVGQPLLMLVGDGNHSLATAKALYEGYKAAGDKRAEKARYALVEIENLWQNGIKFEPIHRVYKGEKAERLALRLKEKFTSGADAEIICGGRRIKIKLPDDAVRAYKEVQDALDGFTAENGGEIDYIHGEGDLKKICAANDSVGIVMPKIKKDSLFDYVINNGVMPRKTFSMGEAWEKRYYMECRSIV